MRVVGRLSHGERLFGASAILLFGLLFFHWFGVVLTNSNSNLLGYLQLWVPDKSGWEALGSSAVLPVLAVVVAVAAVWSRLAIPRRAPHVGLNTTVAALGFLSAGLILLRIIDAPSFYSEQPLPSGLYSEPPLVSESTVQLPMFLALVAALGIALGGLLARREEGGLISESVGRETVLR